jgi:hypothetical protein
VKASGVKLEADVLKAIDEAVGGIAERDPARTAQQTPQERP